LNCSQQIKVFVLIGEKEILEDVSKNVTAEESQLQDCSRKELSPLA